MKAHKKHSGEDESERKNFRKATVVLVFSMTDLGVPALTEEI